MNIGKENCPSAATLGQQVALDGFNETIHVRNNYNTAAGGIASLLSHGKENSVLLRDLMAMTGLDSRTVRQMIQTERLQGSPILSDCQNGYFLPATIMEKDLFVRSMRGRAKEIQKVAEAVEAGGLVDG